MKEIFTSDSVLCAYNEFILHFKDQIHYSQIYTLFVKSHHFQIFGFNYSLSQPYPIKFPNLYINVYINTWKIALFSSAILKSSSDRPLSFLVFNIYNLNCHVRRNADNLQSSVTISNDAGYSDAGEGDVHGGNGDDEDKAYGDDRDGDYLDGYGDGGNGSNGDGNDGENVTDKAYGDDRDGDYLDGYGDGGNGSNGDGDVGNGVDGADRGGADTNGEDGDGAGRDGVNEDGADKNEKNGDGDGGNGADKYGNDEDADKNRKNGDGDGGDGIDKNGDYEDGADKNGDNENGEKGDGADNNGEDRDGADTNEEKGDGEDGDGTEKNEKNGDDNCGDGADRDGDDDGADKNGENGDGADKNGDDKDGADKNGNDSDGADKNGEDGAGDGKDGDGADRNGEDGDGDGANGVGDDTNDEGIKTSDGVSSRQNASQDFLQELQDLLRWPHEPHPLALTWHPESILHLDELGHPFLESGFTSVIRTLIQNHHFQIVLDTCANDEGDDIRELELGPIPCTDNVVEGEDHAQMPGELLYQQKVTGILQLTIRSPATLVSHTESEDEEGNSDDDEVIVLNSPRAPVQDTQNGVLEATGFSPSAYHDGGLCQFCSISPKYKILCPCGHQLCARCSWQFQTGNIPSLLFCPVCGAPVFEIKIMHI